MDSPKRRANSDHFVGVPRQSVRSPSRVDSPKLAGVSERGNESLLLSRIRLEESEQSLGGLLRPTAFCGRRRTRSCRSRRLSPGRKPRLDDETVQNRDKGRLGPSRVS